MWPQDRQDQRQPLTELYDIDWRETSFVPAGDNPPARLVMWKNRQLTDQEIEQIIDEVGRQGVTKTPLDEANELAAKKISADPERFAKMGGSSLVAARSEVWAERPDLREAHAQQPEMVVEPEPDHAPASAELHKGAEAFAKIDAEARKLRPDLYRESPSRARAETAKLRPDLRDEYDRATLAR